MLKAIKAAFKSKPVTITVEEDHDETALILSNPKNREILLKSIAQHKAGELVDVTGKPVEQ
jgi:PHD/YefM family antitoxin component YafN of YafNO toxin-antitoxin module